MRESTDTSLCKVAASSDPSAYRPQLIEVSLDRVAQCGVTLKPKAGSVFLTQTYHWPREKRHNRTIKNTSTQSQNDSASRRKVKFQHCPTIPFRRRQPKGPPQEQA